MRFLILFILVSSSIVSSLEDNFDDYDGELCNRECIEGVNRICYFEFVLEHYQAMGPACKSCARGDFADCFLDQCIVGDMTEKGCQSINRKIPGPAIQVCKNDIVVVDVINHASGTAAAIHWHGMHMRDTPHMDGVPFVTQCPISFSNTFRYNFNASEAGTHFYHSHSGHHKINGQYGALIVREPVTSIPNRGEYDIDSSEHYIILSDWQHSYGEQLFPGIPSNGGIFPDSVLINGIGSYLNPKTARPRNGPVTVFYVEKGKRYRFRLISSVSHACPFQIQVENHKMTLIASDSFNVKPKIVDTLVINSGERYDFVINANLHLGDYWIRVRGLEICGVHPTESYALLRYVESSKDINQPVDYSSLRDKPIYNLLYPSEVVFNHPNVTCFSFSDHCVTELESLEDESEELLNEKADKEFFLGFKNYVVSNKEIFQKGTYRHFINLVRNLTVVGAVNNLTLMLPSYPPLTQPWDIVESDFCDMDNIAPKCANTAICPCTHRIKVDLGDVVDLVVIDESEVPGRMHHPFHLHGFRFLVKSMGQHPIVERMTVDLAKALKVNEIPPLKNNIESRSADGTRSRPPFKDTLSIPSYGFGALRFRADNPGFWLMHCHYEWHVNIGMGLIIQVGEPEEMVKPPLGFPQCGNYMPDF